MANTDKNILITPSTGSATANPTIKFTGANNTPVTLRVLDDGTVSFEGTAGQLFSVSDGLTGTIFSVNDISGIPIIEVIDTGLVRINSLVKITSAGVLDATLVTNSQTASYTLVLADAGKIVELSNASANTLTIPTNANVPFPIGTQIMFLQTETGQTTIAGAGGVTVNGTPGLKLRAQWSSATLIKRGTDVWVAVGDLVA